MGGSSSGRSPLRSSNGWFGVGSMSMASVSSEGPERISGGEFPETPEPKEFEETATSIANTRGIIQDV